jgi:hypothetical protein
MSQVKREWRVLTGRLFMKRLRGGLGSFKYPNDYN